MAEDTHTAAVDDFDEQQFVFHLEGVTMPTDPQPESRKRLRSEFEQFAVLDESLKDWSMDFSKAMNHYYNDKWDLAWRSWQAAERSMAKRAAQQILTEIIVERDTRIARLEEAIKASLAYSHKPGCSCNKRLHNTCSREILLEALGGKTGDGSALSSTSGSEG